MYYGPNYDASSTGVSSPVSPYVSSPEVVSLTVPSPVYPLPDPNDKESNEPHDDHDHVKCDDDKDDFDHTNDFDCDHSDSLYCDHSESLDHDHADNLHHHHPKSLDHGDPDQDCPDDLDHGDDDDDWITPDNLHKAREQMGGATTASAKSVTVGCLTTDFSIQVHDITVHNSYHELKGLFLWPYLSLSVGEEMLLGHILVIAQK